VGGEVVDGRMRRAADEPASLREQWSSPTVAAACPFAYQRQQRIDDDDHPASLTRRRPPPSPASLIAVRNVRDWLRRHERRRPSAATNFAQKWPPTSGAAVSH
jgi:hypothetical protein